jgi:ABC-type branched-subunit amino acid transport system substrate-binding protein
MANDDMAALVAYLKRIETDFDPGLSAERLRIGTLLPTRGRLAEFGASMNAVLRAQVAAINAKGGLFGRQIELVTAEFAEDRAESLKNAERLFSEQQVFAVVSPVTSGIEKEVGELAERLRVPVIGPVTLRTQTTQEVNRYTFFVLPGLAEQARVLVEFSTKQLSLVDPAVAVVHPDEEGLRPVAEAAVNAFRERGWKRSVAVHYPAGRLAARETVAKLQQSGVQVVLFLGTESELEQLGGAIRDAIWTPYLLAPGVRVGRAALALPNTLGNRVFLAYPTQPADVTRDGAAALTRFQQEAGLGARHQPAQIAAYASMLVLEEGLKRAGRDLNRAKLVGAIENLFSFETTVTPAVSYGPTRRIGALGGYVVAVDPSARRLTPASKYIRIE